MSNHNCSIDLEKKSIVFITGASKGIGQTIALELSRQINLKSIFVLLARSNEGLESTKNAIHEIDKAIIVQTYITDLSKPNTEEFARIFDKVLATVDTSDIAFGLIFHNAGHVGELRPTTELTDLQTWRDYFDLNLFSVSLLNSVFVKKVRPIAPQLVAVNITSLCGRSPFKDLAMYGAAKAARELFFRVFALEESNVVVLNYSPGPVATDMFNDIIEKAQSEEVRKNFKEVSETGVLLPTQTVERLIDVLKKGDFKSGDTVDYFDQH